MMSITFSLFAKSIWKYLLVPAVLLVGCGTLEVKLEPTTSPQAMADTTVPVSPTAPMAESPTAEPDALVTEPADLTEDMMALTGRAMAIDPPTGLVILIPETETPFADSNGEVRVRISEWAHIVDTEGAIVDFSDFSRGIKLELKLLFRDGELTSDEVVVLEPGVPPPGENPAYTDVSGLVTPLAEPLPTGDGAIQLFEVDGIEGLVDPGSPLTLNWSFSGESGSICVGQVPSPVTPTCYQDLPPSGSMPVTVPADAREAIIYSLYVQLEEKVESVDLRIPLSEGLGCQYAWFFENAFENDFLLECAAGEAIAIRPQAQNFERGLMLRVEDSWLGQDPYLFAFIWDEERDEFGFTEGPLLDSWSSELPEQVVGEQPPDGLFRPSRGFGLLWNGQIEIPQMGEPRTMDGLGLLGWATGNVFEYDAQYQCGEEFYGNSNCYLSLPDGQIVGLPGRAG
jgi:hypothetical protein